MRSSDAVPRHGRGLSFIRDPSEEPHPAPPPPVLYRPACGRRHFVFFRTAADQRHTTWPESYPTRPVAGASRPERGGSLGHWIRRLSRSGGMRRRAGPPPRLKHSIASTRESPPPLGTPVRR